MPPQLAMEPGSDPSRIPAPVPSRIAGPAGRLEAIGADIAMLDGEVARQVAGASGATGSSHIQSACGDFAAAIQTVFRALGEDTRLLSMRLREAGVPYRSVKAGAENSPR